jgi:hypothetical protein
MKYEVPIIYNGLCTFIVEADSPEQAKEKAEAKFNGGDQPDTLGNEWESIVAIHEPEAMDPQPVPENITCATGINRTNPSFSPFTNKGSF